MQRVMDSLRLPHNPLRVPKSDWVRVGTETGTDDDDESLFKHGAFTFS